LLTLAALTAVPAIAQTQRPDAGTLQRQQRDSIRPATPDLDRAQGLIRRPADAASRTAPASTAQVTLSRFVFVGNTRISTEDLNAALKPYLGRPLTLADLGAAADLATTVYRERGYNVARVLLPPQDIGDNAATLLVLEGYIDRQGPELVDLSGGRTDMMYLLAILNRQIDWSAPINRREYERALRLIDNLPGVTVRSVIYPGTEPGTAHLRIEAFPIAAARGGLVADNYGARSTGSARLSGYAVIENTAGRHERVRIDASTTGPGLNFIGIDAMLPVGTDGWMVGAYADYLQYDVRDGFDGADNEQGYASHLALNASYPLWLLADISLTAAGSVNYINQIDRSVVIGREDRTIGYLNFALLGERSWHGGRPAASLAHVALSFGRVDTVTGVDTFGSNGGFSVIEAELNHVLRLSRDWSSQHVLGAQTASQNLNGFFKCSVGGPVSNRGYPVGQFVADRCVKFTNELQWHMPEDLWGARLQLSGFIDLAKARENINPVPGQNNYSDTLSSAGLGALALLPRGHELSATVARQLKTTKERDASGFDADQRSSRTRLWVQGVLRF
jgi:hemolysin activation/secretion protein